MSLQCLQPLPRTAFQWMDPTLSMLTIIFKNIYIYNIYTHIYPVYTG